jgi:uncharacterized protein (DUF952 family)
MSIFHITTADEAAAAHAAGTYRPAAFDREGFIHCSYARQVIEVANRLFRGRTDLVLLEIDPSRLSGRVVEENLEGGREPYPHVYGELPEDAIVAVHPFPIGPDGRFDMPPQIPYNSSPH